MSTELRGPRFSLIQALQFSRDPAAFMQEGVRRYGDPFVATLPTGAVAITGSPEGIKQILTADPAHFEQYAKAFLEPAVGTNSVILISGERHRRERKLLMPPFHGERMRAYGALMQQSALRTLEGLKPGGTWDAQVMGLDMSLQIIILAVFGVEEPERVQRFIDALTAYTKAYTPLIAMLAPLRRSFGGVGPWARFQRVFRELDVLLADQIARRRADTRERGDILGLLLAARDEEGQPMSEEDLKDELRSLLLAGHETTATSIAWTLYWLHRNPEVLQRLREELGALGPQPAPEALVKAPYLAAVIDESLRMSPALAVLARRLVTPFTLMGHELPVGMGVMPSITLAHFNPATFPEPERFRPERFLDRKYSPFEYLPFGGGTRRCLGAAFALYELKVVLGTVLSSGRFSPVHDRPIRPVLRNATVGPSEPILLRYEGPLHTAAAA